MSGLRLRWCGAMMGAACMIGCQRDPSGGAGGPRGDGPTNVLFISMDTTRADHLACYGHPTSETPNIDRLAREGALFRQCIAPAPLTLPSHTSMMTGAEPFTHGARDNGQFFVHPDNLTLAEVLHDAGYATGAEVATYVLNREYGLSQGFEHYGDVNAARKLASAAGEAPTTTERIAEDVCDGAIAWLRERGDRPFFLFVHFFDPHAPYAPPERFSRFKKVYLGEIAYVDEQIGRLLAALDELKLARDTLVVLTADHGEGLGQHEETHGYFVYDVTLHVPLVMRWPGHIPAGKTVASTVRTIDIAPTVLDYLERPALPHADGLSLRPLLIGTSADLHLVAYSESLFPKFNLGYAWQRALRDGEWKYIHAKRPELYHIMEDPLEQRDLASEQPARVARMREALRAMLAAAKPVVLRDAAQQDLTPEARRALESLGYLSAGGATESAAASSELDWFEPVGAEPKDFVEENQLMGRAGALLTANRPREAAAVLRELLEKSNRPQTFWWAHRTLGEALSLAGDYDGAVEAFRAALQERPADGATRGELAHALVSAGRREEAFAEYKLALSQPPVFARAHFEYGEALADAGREDEALAQFEEAVKLDPTLGRAHAARARILQARGRTEELLASLEAAVNAAPRALEFRDHFSQALLDAGRDAAALAQAQAWVEMAPNSAPALERLGEALLRLNRPDEAAEKLMQAAKLAQRRMPIRLRLIDALTAAGRYVEALDAARESHALAPNQPDLMSRLARLLATAPDDGLRDAAQALELAERAASGTGRREPGILETLAAAQANRGDFATALKTIDEALALARERQPQLVEELQATRKRFEQGESLRLPK